MSDLSPEQNAKERIAKVMARAGLCSRRDAEAWIKDGRVAVNGKTITSPALNVGPEEAITVDGQPMGTRERTRLFLYHKPRGLVTTARDPEGRPTVFDALPPELPRLVSVGRLDINTEGLLLLTNDGGLARVLELPATGWLRRYRVRANGFVAPERLAALADGITIEGVHYAGIEASLDRTQGANQWLTMGLREGKNREIKRVLEHLGLTVNRLIRVSFGPFQLGDLDEGAIEEVRPRVLKDQLGPALAEEAGVAWEDAVSATVVTQSVKGRDAAPNVRPERARRGGEKADAPARRTADRPRTEATPRRAAEPRRDRPAASARPHVSALRTERPATGDEPRKRIRRATTEDRRGRTVAVERVTVETKDRHRSGDAGTSRNARNFARERRERDEAAAPAAPRGRRTRAQGQEVRTDEVRASRPRTPRAGTGERTGGFSSGRPLTGRALKDGKVRRPPRAETTDASRGGAKPRTGRPGGGGGKPPRGGAPAGGAPRGRPPRGRG